MCIYIYTSIHIYAFVYLCAHTHISECIYPHIHIYIPLSGQLFGAHLEIGVNFGSAFVPGKFPCKPRLSRPSCPETSRGQLRVSFSSSGSEGTPPLPI